MRPTRRPCRKYARNTRRPCRIDFPQKRDTHSPSPLDKQIVTCFTCTAPRIGVKSSALAMFLPRGRSGGGATTGCRRVTYATRSTSVRCMSRLRRIRCTRERPWCAPPRTPHTHRAREEGRRRGGGRWGRTSQPWAGRDGAAHAARRLGRRAPRRSGGRRGDCRPDAIRRH